MPRTFATFTTFTTWVATWLRYFVPLLGGAAVLLLGGYCVALLGGTTGGGATRWRYCVALLGD